MMKDALRSTRRALRDSVLGAWRSHRQGHWRWLPRSLLDRARSAWPRRRMRRFSSLRMTGLRQDRCGSGWESTPARPNPVTATITERLPNRAARLMAIGHGGQILVSNVDGRIDGRCSDFSVKLVDLGEHRLRDLSRPEHVFQLAAPDLEQKFPPLLSINVLPTNLPVQLTSFVGRAAEVRSLAALLTDHRIVTLTGVGGVGKAAGIAGRGGVARPYRDGAWFADLSSVEPPRLVAVVAAAFGIEMRSGQTVEASLLDVLRLASAAPGTRQLRAPPRRGSANRRVDPAGGRRRLAAGHEP